MASKHPISSIETLGEDDDDDDGAIAVTVDDIVDHQELLFAGEASLSSSGGVATRSRQQHQQPPQPKPKMKKKKDSILSDPRLLQAIEEARYEAFVDPYRGIAPFFWVADSAENSAAAAAAATDNNNEQSVVMMHDDDDDDEDGDRWWKRTNVHPENMKSPWEKCSTVLNTTDCGRAWSFRDWEYVHGVVNVDDDDEDEFYDIKDNNRRRKNNEQMTLLVQCGCPTVDKLAMDAFEADHKLHKKKKAGGRRARKRMKKKLNDADTLMKSDDSEESTSSSSSSSIVLPRLICGERSADAIPQHPCDYNPVSRLMILVLVMFASFFCHYLLTLYFYDIFVALLSITRWHHGSFSS